MGIRIDALDATASPSRLHELPAIKDGLTVKLTVGQILDLIIDSAPGALDTLNELAAALGDDANFATTVTNALALKAPLASPVFTGNPTAPTPSPGDNDTSIATTAFVFNAVKQWVDIAPVATTSGTSKDWVIPAGVTDIELWYDGVSLSGTDNALVQIGASSTPQTTSYTSSSAGAGTTSRVNSTAGFIALFGAAGRTLTGVMRLHKTSGNRWVSEHVMGDYSGEYYAPTGGGSVTASGEIDILRATATGSNNFDAGSIKVRYR